eukprot:Gb_28693 [translate_table: standard]
MALASTSNVVLGCIGFVIFWILAIFPAVPFLPIGRTAGSLLGAMFMVAFGVISPDEAYDAIDLSVLGLLFGMMLVSVYLERADMFKYLGQLLSWRSRGGQDLLCRISFLTAIGSALFTNDTCCVVFTEFVLKLCRQNNLPPQPFLLALASSANIGSACTPIGNPQDLVIAVQSKISFGKFLVGILPSMLIGVMVNTLIILILYWKVLSVEKDEEAVAEVAEEEVKSHRFSPATLAHVGSANSPDLSTFDSPNPSENGITERNEYLRNRTSVESELQRAESSAVESIRPAIDSNEDFVGIEGRSNEREEGTNEREEGISSRRSLRVNSHTSSAREILSFDGLEDKETAFENWKIIIWKTCVYLVTIGMLIALLCGFNLSWTAITAATALVVLDFTDARPSLEKDPTEKRLAFPIQWVVKKLIA